MKQLPALACAALLLAEPATAKTCCNTPTSWTIINQSPHAAQLICSLKKSNAWSGHPIHMKTETINPGATSVYTWDQKWYSDGMGMVPGTWTCANAGSRKPELTFSTDWGENVKILWGKRHADVARR